MRENWWYRVRDNFVCWVLYDLFGCSIANMLPRWAMVFVCIVFPSRWFWYVCGKHFYNIATHTINIKGVQFSMRFLERIVMEAEDEKIPKIWYSFFRMKGSDSLLIETKLDLEKEVENGE